MPIRALFGMIELPTLLLTANVSSVFGICAQLEDAADPVVCDASRLVVAEPMALCAFSGSLRIASTRVSA